MRFTSIVLFDHTADFGGVADINDLCCRAADEIRTLMSEPDEGWIEIAWVASEALGVVEPIDDEDDCPASWAEARAEFLADRPFISQTLGEEPSEVIRRRMLPPVIKALAAELAAEQEKTEVLAQHLRACADWLVTGLPGIVAEKSINPFSGRNYDLRDRREPPGPGVLVKVHTRV